VSFQFGGEMEHDGAIMTITGDVMAWAPDDVWRLSFGRARRRAR